MLARQLALSLQVSKLRCGNKVKHRIKPVRGEQVFYDKFSCGKFYLSIARVYVQQIFYDKFLVF
jgi:hypothetical protein